MKFIFTMMFVAAAFVAQAQKTDIDYRKVPYPQPMYGKALTFDQKNNAAFAFANGERASTRASVFTGKDSLHALYYNKYHAQFVDLTQEQLEAYRLRVKKREKLLENNQLETKKEE